MGKKKNFEGLMAKLSWLADHARVTICAGDSRWPRYSFQTRFSAMSDSPNPTAPQQVTPLLALATRLLGAGRPADAMAPLRSRFSPARNGHP